MNEPKPVMMRADALMQQKTAHHPDGPPVLTEQLPSDTLNEDYMQFLQNRLMTDLLAEIEVLLPILVARITAEWKANHRL